MTEWYQKRGAICVGDWYSHCIIDVTNYCPMKCTNCNRGCDVVDHHNWLIVQDVIDFLQNISQRQIISIEGGEPTYHPKLIDIIDIAAQLHPTALIQICTNGHSKHTQNILDTISHIPRVIIVDSHKEPGDIKQNNGLPFEKFRVSPKSLAQPREYLGCTFPFRSGPSLASNGRVYPCPCMGLIDDAFQLSIGYNIENAWRLDIPTAFSMMLNACEYCGRSHARTDLDYEASDDWTHAMEEYNARYN